MEGARRNYAERINQDIAGERMYDKVSKIRRLQTLFKPGEVPVHLLGKGDARLYSGTMIASVIGLAFTFGTMGLMATNNLKKK